MVNKDVHKNIDSAKKLACLLFDFAVIPHLSSTERK